MAPSDLEFAKKTSMKTEKINIKLLKKEKKAWEEGEQSVFLDFITRFVNCVRVAVEKEIDVNWESVLAKIRKTNTHRTEVIMAIYTDLDTKRRSMSPDAFEESLRKLIECVTSELDDHSREGEDDEETKSDVVSSVDFDKLDVLSPGNFRVRTASTHAEVVALNNV